MNIAILVTLNQFSVAFHYVGHVVPLSLCTQCKCLLIKGINLSIASVLVLNPLVISVQIYGFFEKKNKNRDFFSLEDNNFVGNE